MGRRLMRWYYSLSPPVAAIQRPRCRGTVLSGAVDGPFGDMFGCTLGMVLSAMAAVFFLKPVLTGTYREEGLSQ